jgi:nucleoid-associated protein YgaU
MISVEVRPDTGPAVAALETVLVAPFALPEADEEEVVIAAAPDPVPEADAAEGFPSDRPTEVPTTEAVNEALPSEADQPSIATDPGIAVAPDTSPAPTTAAPELATDQSPAVLIAGPEGLRISQPPGRPEVLSEILLDAISYDASGAVILAGRGPATADIQVMINNQPIQLGEVGPDGAWSLQLPDVDPGTYTLSVAELAEDGSVASQIETPFLREDPERIAEGAAAQGGATGIDVITVQPGFTLWGIAERNFGDGIQYVQIFEENRDQIRDPNWIFPGQIFRLPEIDPDAPEN